MCSLRNTKDCARWSSPSWLTDPSLIDSVNSFFQFRHGEKKFWQRVMFLCNPCHMKYVNFVNKYKCHMCASIFVQICISHFSKCIVIMRRIPRGMVAAILFLADQVICDWSNHTTWFHSNRALPRSMELESMLLYFFTQYSRQYAVGCLMIVNTWTYTCIYIRNTFILENKNLFVFFHMTLIGQFEKFFLKFIKCQSHSNLFIAMVIYSGCE